MEINFVTPISSTFQAQTLKLSLNFAELKKITFQLKLKLQKVCYICMPQKITSRFFLRLLNRKLT